MFPAEVDGTSRPREVNGPNRRERAARDRSTRVIAYEM
jgi:hypothetical protein